MNQIHNKKRGFCLVAAVTSSALLVFATLLSLSAFFSWKAAADLTNAPPEVSNGYGVPDDHYREGLHPGFDYELPMGTPVVAVSDGQVRMTRAKYKEEDAAPVFMPIKKSKADGNSEPATFGGYYVIVRHDGHFLSFYHHLSKFFVDQGESVKRGQLIGLSGRDARELGAHLHYGVFKFRGTPRKHSQTYDPDELWLEGKAQCFDPKRDYSTAYQNQLTHPVACGEHYKSLINKNR